MSASRNYYRHSSCIHQLVKDGDKYYHFKLKPVLQITSSSRCWDFVKRFDDWDDAIKTSFGIDPSCQSALDNMLIDEDEVFSIVAQYKERNMKD